MKLPRQFPWLIVACEVAVGLGLIGWRLTRPVPPLPDLSRMSPATADAIRQLNAATWSDRSSSWLELGKLYLAQGYFSEAEVCMARAATKSPHDYHAAYGHASSLERLGRLQDANAQFQRAADLTTGRATQNCQFRIARNALRIGDPQAAEAAFDRALSFPPAQVAHMRFLARNDRAAEALPILNQMRAERELDVVTEMAAVEVFRALNRPADAEAAAERADRAQQRIQLTGHWEELQPIRLQYGTAAEIQQMEALVNAGREAVAAEKFDQLLAALPEDFQEALLTTGARINLYAHRPQRAVEYIDQLSQRLNLVPFQRHLQGQVLIEAGREDDAVAVLNKANELQPFAASYDALEKLHRKRRESNLAREAAMAAQLQRGIDLYTGNQLAEALTDLEAACKQDPRNVQGWYFLGLVQAASGHPREARIAFEHCLALDRFHGRAKAALARLP